jgi:glycosyltransferase involved in cell wall biosynthesis
MRVLLAHDYYQLQGGEDLSFEAEAALLEGSGHDVVRYSVHNDGIEDRSRAALALRSIWNGRVAAELRELVIDRRIEVAHFHNTFPLLSPAAFYAARRAGAAVVETVQNYRLLCANALLFRNGHVCEECVGKRAPWRGVLHRCYRDSRVASAAVATMIGVHSALRTWDRAVDVYVTPSDFTARKLAALGMSRAEIRHKVNFVHPDPGRGAGAGRFAVFVGRFSPEKGLGVLLEAWRELGGAIPLKVVGSGPLTAMVEAEPVPGVEVLGRRSAAEVLRIIGDASVLVAPSIWYEGLPRVVIEAFARGTPVVASRIGALAEAVEDGVTGVLFNPGDAGELARAVRTLLAEPERLTAMRVRARAAFEASYTAERNLAQLLGIYELARERRANRS